MPYYPSHQDSRLGIHQSSSPKTLHRTHNLRSAVWASLLGGSCVAICGVISSLTRVIHIGTLLITPLTTTNEPPSRIVLFVGGVVDPSQAHIHIYIYACVYTYTNKTQYNIRYLVKHSMQIINKNVPQNIRHGKFIIYSMQSMV